MSGLIATEIGPIRASVSHNSRRARVVARFSARSGSTRHQRETKRTEALSEQQETKIDQDGSKKQERAECFGTSCRRRRQTAISESLLKRERCELTVRASQDLSAHALTLAWALMLACNRQRLMLRAAPESVFSHTDKELMGDIVAGLRSHLQVASTCR